MSDEEGAPMVPDIRSRNRRGIDDECIVDGDCIKEDIDALRIETPFVPVVAKRRGSRLSKVGDLHETDD